MIKITLSKRIGIIACTLLTLSAMLGIGLLRLDIETDIINSLPKNDPVISDAGYIFANHPIQDQIAIDIGLQKEDPDQLVEGAGYVERELQRSGLFKSVGMKEMQHLFPELMTRIANNLPVLFSENELMQKVEPLLTEKSIRQNLTQLMDELYSLDSIGQSSFIDRDPLALRNIVMARMAHLAPSDEVHIRKGYLVSPDNRHLLIMARPKGSGTDTLFSRKMTALVQRISAGLDNAYAKKGAAFKLTPVGSYRAALDNELTARADTQRAMVLVTVGIVLLLVLAFPRPLIGLLSLVPAFAGIMIAVFAFSLLHRSISILTLGFGGAIVSITVDHGIAYLLFLDQPRDTYGKEAAREVRAVGLLATLTTVGAFLSLLASGFPLLSQVGEFTAMGVLFSFLFIHLIFPRVFPVMPASQSSRPLPIRSLVNAAALKGGKTRLIAAGAITLFMLFFARPEFHVDLSSMNSVTEETLAAENLITGVWGNIFDRIYLLTEDMTVGGLQSEGDRLAREFRKDVDAGILKSAFIPSMIFPGNDQSGENFKAWKQFWGRERTRRLKETIRRVSSDIGFAGDAFRPFYDMIGSVRHEPSPVPEPFYGLLGISRKRDGSSWIQFSTLVPGPRYAAGDFYSRYAVQGKVRIFDPRHFSTKLGNILSDTFLKMLIIIGASVILLLTLFFFDWKLTLASLLPILFALISTLGTMKLIGHPLDIPGLMLSIIVLGMGIDYSLFLVRSYQRYRDEAHPSMGLVRMTVFLASSSTIIGFGSLAFARHSLLKSAGLTCLLGISYSLMGAFLILPPILRRMFITGGPVTMAPGHGSPGRRLLSRFRHMEPYPRIFARFKLMMDPLFGELERFLARPAAIIDMGCGYGIPAAWILEKFPDVSISGIDPDPERVRVASYALGPGCSVTLGRAPDLPAVRGRVDAVLMIDMIHYLSDKELSLTLKRLAKKMKTGASLVIRATIPSQKRFTLLRTIEMLTIKAKGLARNYRSEKEIRKILRDSGLKPAAVEDSGRNREEKWFIAKRAGEDRDR